MGAGCCRARILPGQGPHAHAPGPPPRPAWGPAWGPAGPDPSIASLRPGDKFHFNRDPFIRQHLVVPDKPFSSNGVHNPAFTSDGGALAVRPSALPSLPTPPPSPTAVPVPPPRKKRRARAAPGGGGPSPVPAAAPQPPSRARAASRQRLEKAGAVGAEQEDDGAMLGSNDSILSPAHTMELLKRMARVEARFGTARPGQRARSMDSLDALDASAGRARTLPGRGLCGVSRGASQTSLDPADRAQDAGPDGPRSLDLDFNREGVVGVAAFTPFTLQSWDERRGAGDRPWSPPLPLSTSAVLISPRQWRPVSSPPPNPPRVTSSEAMGAAADAPAAPGNQDDTESRSALRACSPHQSATTKAMSEFIKDTYALQGAAEGATPVQPADAKEIREPGKADVAPEGVVGSSELSADSAAAASRTSATASETLVPRVVVSGPTGSGGPTTAEDGETGACLLKRARFLDVDASSTEDRAGSSASSTTESLGELEDDILHMLSSKSDRAGAESGAESEAEADEADRAAPPSESTLPSSELVRQQQRQYMLALVDS